MRSNNAFLPNSPTPTWIVIRAPTSRAAFHTDSISSGVPPGDATSVQIDTVADLAERYSFGEVRVSHEQNLILADVKLPDLHAIWQEAKKLGMATPNIGLLTNIICCPGGDFCSLANARSIPVAQAIQERFDDLDYLYDLGPIEIKMSGCMNACGHHHVGHIGILGVDKRGEEFFQLTLGGLTGLRAYPVRKLSGTRIQRLNSELRWAARTEGVEHLDDLMLRRTRLGLLLPEGGRAQLERIKSITQGELGWSEERWAKEIEQYLSTWRRAYGPPSVVLANR